MSQSIAQHGEPPRSVPGSIHRGKEFLTEGSKMHIVMIGPFALTPKATVSARALPMAQALTTRGHTVTLLLPPYDNPADAGKTLTRCGVEVRNLPLRRVNPLTPLSAAWRLTSWARGLRPDVVHAFKPVGYAALAAMILRATSHLPLVIDTDDWEGTGGWNSVNPYPWLWKRFFDYQERWLPRHADAVTVASRTLQTQVWGMGVPPSRVYYVPNCPGSDLLARRTGAGEVSRAQVRAQLKIGDAPMAIYVGHITRGDDLDLGLRALAEVRNVVPRAVLTIVGAGDGLPRLQSLVTQMGLRDAVRFVGWLDHRHVPAYLAAADIAIYPYRDSLINRAKCSIKILEYMAMGKAIVTNRVGQNAEYLEHQRSGYLADPGDVADFARGMIATLTDRALAERMGAAAARRIEDSFRWSQRVCDVERAYRAAIDTRA